MACNYKTLVTSTLRSIDSHIATLKTHDSSDPMVRAQVFEANALRSVVAKVKSKKSLDALYSRVQGLTSYTTQAFNKVFTSSGLLKARGPRDGVRVLGLVSGVEIGDSTTKVHTYKSSSPDTITTYTFKNGQDDGVDLSGKPLSIPGLGEFTSIASDTTKFGSSEDSPDTKNRRKIEDYVNGNIDSMVKVIDDLDDGKDPEYTEYVKGFLRGLDPKFFKDLELYLGEAVSGNHGTATADVIEIYTGPGSKARNSQSAVEVYFHEVLHPIIMFAFNSDKDSAREAARELRALVKAAKASVTQEDLYPRNPSEEEIKKAESLYSYMFKNHNGEVIGDQEFIIHAVSNPAVMKVLSGKYPKTESKSILGKIAAFLYKIVRTVTGKMSVKDTSVDMYSHAVNVLLGLARASASAETEAEYKESLLDPAVDFLNKLDRNIAASVEYVKGKALGDGEVKDKYPIDGTEWEKSVYLVKFLKYSMTDEVYRKTFGLFLSGIGIAPTNSLREIVGRFFERNEVEKLTEWLGLASASIDTSRESLVNTSRNIIIDAFDGELDKDTDEALVKVLVDTNAGVIYKGYGIDKLQEFLTDPSSLTDEISILEEAVANEVGESKSNWFLNQSKGLGYYMATHKGNVAQLTSSYNIAIGAGVGGYNPSDTLVTTIERLSSLHAVKYTVQEQNDVSLVISAINKSKKGVIEVINMAEAVKSSAKNQLFQDDPGHIIDGYTNEQFDSDVDLVVKKLSDRGALERAGYTFIKKFNPITIEGEVMGMYVSKGYGVNERLRGAVRLVSATAKGTTVKEIVLKTSSQPSIELRVLNKQYSSDEAKTHKLMASKRVEPSTLATGMLAIRDSHGNTSGYRLIMNKKDKKEYLKQDTRASEVIPRSNGHILDKASSKVHLENVLDSIKQNMEDNWESGRIGKDGLTEYVVLSKDAENDAHREAFEMLPRVFLKYANSRKDKSIAVPASLFHELFGYKHMSLSSNKYTDKLPGIIKQLIGFIDTLWVDVVKVAKGNILLRMPATLVGNIVSNFMIRVVNGVNPLTLIEDYKRSTKEVRAFIKNSREILELETKVASMKEQLKGSYLGSLATEIKSKEASIVHLKATNDKSSVKELVDAGLYQTIVEDVDTKVLEGTTVFEKLASTLLSKAPKGVTTAAEVLYLTKNTTWFKINQEVLQLSDLVARDVHNRSAKRIEARVAGGRHDVPAWWVEEKGVPAGSKLDPKDAREFLEKSHKVRMYSLLETYINYNRPSGRTEEFLNRMGILMFTKYAKSIQRVIFNQSTHHPLKSILAAMVNSGVADIDMIQDQYILAKEWHTETHGFGNFYPLYSVFDHIESVVTPSLIKDTTWNFLPL